MRIKNCFFLVPVFFLLACGTLVNQSVSELTPAERQLCDSLNLDTGVVQLLRKHTSASVRAFNAFLYKQYFPDGKIAAEDSIHLPGLVFNVNQDETEDLYTKLNVHLKVKGYSILTLDKMFGLEDKKDVMAIVNTSDKYTILEQIKTNGINYDINTDSLVKLVKVFDAKYSLELTGAGLDWCEFNIRSEKTDWIRFANEIYKICPDIVDQGTSSVDALAIEMKKTRKLFLWWD